MVENNEPSPQRLYKEKSPTELLKLIRKIGQYTKSKTRIPKRTRK